jgi:hypothetical protein
MITRPLRCGALNLCHNLDLRIEKQFVLYCIIIVHYYHQRVFVSFAVSFLWIIEPTLTALRYAHVIAISQDRLVVSFVVF